MARFQAVPGRSSLRVGQAVYRQIVLPRTPILDLASARTLAAFVRSGGRLVVVGGLPSREAFGRDAALAATFRGIMSDISLVSDTSGLTAGVSFAAAKLEPAVPAVRVIRISRGRDIAFLVNNESDATVRTTATFPASGVPEIWEPRTGSADAATTYRGSSVPLTLEPYQTIGVVFRHGARPAPHLTDGQLPATEVTVGGTRCVRPSRPAHRAATPCAASTGDAPSRQRYGWTTR